MLERRKRALAGLGALVGLSCAPGGPSDLWVERCSEVVRYRHPALRELSILDARHEADSGAVTLDFRARLEGSRAPLASQITCAFEPSDRWSLAGVRIGGRALTDAEVALVNAELLLRDLSRSPERLGRAS